MCDNASDTRGVTATLSGTRPGGGDQRLRFSDPSNDGDCASFSDNYFADGYYVYVKVCEYRGDNNDYNCSEIVRGVA